MGAYSFDHAEISVEGVAVVHEDACDAKAVHGRYQLVADLPALAHSADDQLAAIALALGHSVDSGHEAFLSNRVGLVELLYVCQPVSFCGDNVERSAKSCCVARGVKDLIRVGRCHGQWWDWFADMGETGWEEW